SQKDGMRSVLTLNNNMDEVTNVDVTIFNRQGKSLRLTPISLKRHSITDFRLEELTKDVTNQFDEGSIEIRFHGDMLGVTSQVGVFQDEQRIGFDSTEAMVMSSKLNGIVSIPASDAEAFLAMTNIAGPPIAVTRSVGKKDKKVALRSRETAVIKLNQYFEKSATASLVRLQHDGPDGAIIVSGFVLNQKTGFSSRFAMQDPLMS